MQVDAKHRTNTQQQQNTVEKYNRTVSIMKVKSSVAKLAQTLLDVNDEKREKKKSARARTHALLK